MPKQQEKDRLDIIEETFRQARLEIPKEVPLLSVRDIVVFPDMILPIFISRKESVAAVEASIEDNGFILLCTQKEPELDKPGADDFYKVGTIGIVQRLMKLSDGKVRAIINGIMRAKIVKYVKKRPLFVVQISPLQEQNVDKISIEVEAVMRNVKTNAEKIMSIIGDFSSDMGAVFQSFTEPGSLADMAASSLPLRTEEVQSILEEIDPVKRIKKVDVLLSREVKLSTIQARIESRVERELSKNQKDHFLREQLRAIHKELGERDDKEIEIEDYEKKIKKAKMPDYAEKEAFEELDRLSMMMIDSSEASTVRNYLDWLVEMPWSKSTKDFIDIKKSKEVLDKNHYGLVKVKDRILEYLSVRKLNPKMKGPILCFAGPPGVGKTSLGRAIAHSLKRKFVRISLGGIRDEAEIRGHRRTYVGAMPGRIVQSIKQSGTNNPVFMMDEIDKMGNDFRGDPSSALLEALDPEQNFEFSDHFLNIPFDLSKVMFILTANQTDTIPSALLDRMEVIELSSYTEEEKNIIAKKHLILRQLKENGLNRRKVSISEKCLIKIISEYTKEAGLRNLERELGKIFRKIAREIAEGQKGVFNVSVKNIEKYLGPPKFYPEMDREESQPGLCTGLAWTQAGGELLYVEAAVITGKGELIVTGQLGEVMQESATAALSYAKSKLKSSKFNKKYFENIDVHIHVPAGAIPKDGPSAGIAMATALVSVFTNRPISKDIAMTGEITLRGRVLPIGGLKEKAIAAFTEGIKTIIIPEKNKRDLEEIPSKIRDQIDFIQVSLMDQVLDRALEKSVQG